MSNTTIPNSDSMRLVIVSHDQAAFTATDIEAAIDDLRGHLPEYDAPQVLGPDALSLRLQGLTDQEAGQLKSALQKTLSGRADFALLPTENARKKLLICDMDSTIIRQECLDELADYAGLKAEIAEVTQRAMRGELDFETALTERVAKLNGLTVDAIQQCYEERITLTPGAQTLVHTMKDNGAHCLLVSGGFTVFTSRVADAAGFHENHANILFDDGKALSGAVATPILGREAKLETLNHAASEHGLTAKDALAMGDGANDLAMIAAAGLGIGYRPHDVIRQSAHAVIDGPSLHAALYFQGYHRDEFVCP